MYLNTSNEVKCRLFKLWIFYLIHGGLLEFGRHWSDLKSDAVRRESSSLSSPITFWIISLNIMVRATGNCKISVQVRYNPLTNVIGSGVHYWKAGVVTPLEAINRFYFWWTPRFWTQRFIYKRWILIYLAKVRRIMMVYLFHLNYNVCIGIKSRPWRNTKYLTVYIYT